MSKNSLEEEKKTGAWIQFKVSDSEYNDIQRIKAENGKSRTPNKDYYRELLIKGLKLESI
jgi:hypothetical protein